MWDGKSFLTSSPPISWDWVCKPKKYGGLGVIDCLSWNLAAQGRYIWQVAMKADTLWVKWVHCVYIKGHNWWNYIPPREASWSWESICKVKDELKNGFLLHGWCNVGSSLSTSILY